MDTKSLVEGIAIGAVAGAVGALLLAPQSGRETRDEIALDLMEVRDKVVTQLEALEDFTQEKYAEVVAAVIGEFSAAKKITVNEAKDLEARLRGGYEAVHESICEHTTLPVAPAPAQAQI